MFKLRLRQIFCYEIFENLINSVTHWVFIIYYSYFKFNFRRFPFKNSLKIQLFQIQICSNFNFNSIIFLILDGQAKFLNIKFFKIQFFKLEFLKIDFISNLKFYFSKFDVLNFNFAKSKCYCTD